MEGVLGERGSGLCSLDITQEIQREALTPERSNGNPNMYANSYDRNTLVR